MKLTEDSKTIILLCASLQSAEKVSPLNAREYAQIARWLHETGRRPGDLQGPALLDELILRFSHLERSRLDFLLHRGAALGFALEEWQRAGIWLVSKSDPAYPHRYKKHLQEEAPPVLFCMGNAELLEGGGLGMVGSRNVAPEGEEFARHIAKICAEEDMLVISGCARGVDKIAMGSALAAGGQVIGIAADNLLKKSFEPEFRKSLQSGKLLLVSPYNPTATFHVWRAMERNKLIYGLADYTLVVQADYKKGGTWAGAAEELKRSTRLPVFVRAEPPKAARALVDMGALAWPHTERHIRESLEAAVGGGADETAVPEQNLPVPPEGGQRDILEDKQMCLPSAYELVLPTLLQMLEKPAKLKDLSQSLQVNSTQMKDWLEKALADRQIVLRRMGSTKLYVRAGELLLPGLKS